MIEGEQSQEIESARGARIAGTAIVAVGVVVLLFAAAAVTFFLLGELLHGQWLPAVAALVVLCALFLLLNRLVRVAVNQNKKPVG